MPARPERATLTLSGAHLGADTPRRGASRTAPGLGDDGIGGAFFTTAAFAADEKRVLIVSEEGGLNVWDPSPAAATRAACQAAGRDLTTEEWQTYLPEREPFEVCPH